MMFLRLYLNPLSYVLQTTTFATLSINVICTAFAISFPCFTRASLPYRWAFIFKLDSAGSLQYCWNLFFDAISKAFSYPSLRYRPFLKIQAYFNICSGTRYHGLVNKASIWAFVNLYFCSSVFTSVLLPIDFVIVDIPQIFTLQLLLKTSRRILYFW